MNHPPSQSDGLEAITNLRNLISRTKPHAPAPSAPAVATDSNAAQTDNAGTSTNVQTMAAPICTPTTVLQPEPSNFCPNIILYEPHENIQTTSMPSDPSSPRYNLQSKARHIISSVLATQHSDFCCAVTDNDTEKALEYRHLIKNPAYAQTWSHSYATNSGVSPKAYATFQALTQCFLSENMTFHSHSSKTLPTVELW